MKKSHINIALTIGLLFLFFPVSLAQDFVYKPKNPAFGGEVFNFQWLLNAANAQNTFTDGEEDLYDPFDRNELENFGENLNNQLLNQLSRNLIDNKFGETLTEGSYLIGDYQIDIEPTNEGMSITILDIVTGGETIIIVPYY